MSLGVIFLGHIILLICIRAITYRAIARLSNRFTLWNKIDNYRRLVTNELWFYHHDQSLAPLQGKLGTETLVLEAFLVIDCASTVWASS